MPLLDHFRPPTSDDAPWESFNTLWVAALVRWLNGHLPDDRYRAFAQVHLGPHVEADVAEFERTPAGGGGNGVATVEAVAPPAVVTIPAIFPDDVEVRITETRNTQRLVAVIELVSPGNKKEPDERRSFAAKCMSYLRRGIGLAVVDAVTERRANLHDELMRLMGLAPPPGFPPDTPIYTVGYRPVRRGERNEIDLWPFALHVGDRLPLVPLGLRGGSTVLLDLETTYQDACDWSRLS